MRKTDYPIAGRRQQLIVAPSPTLGDVREDNITVAMVLHRTLPTAPIRLAVCSASRAACHSEITLRGEIDDSPRQINCQTNQILIFVSDPTFLRHEDENSDIQNENLHVEMSILKISVISRFFDLR